MRASRSWSIVACAAACAASLPAPPLAAPPRSAFVDVPYPPPPAQVERVPNRPRSDAVWVDGSWEWSGRLWRWKDGGWFAPPAPGVKYAPWAMKLAAALCATGCAKKNTGVTETGMKYEIIKEGTGPCPNGETR